VRSWSVRTLRPAAQLTFAARWAAPWLAVVAASLVSAALATGQAQARLGEKPALFVLAALLAGTFLVVFAFLGSFVVVVWPVAATVGYLVNIPRSHPVITFDRMWIGGMLVYVALNPRLGGRSIYTRRLVIALLWLTIGYGLRAATTAGSINGPVATWVNAIVLPAILFVACERYCLAGADRARRLTGALAIAGGILGAIGIAERIWGFELATLTGGTVRFDAVIDQTRISGPYPVPETYALSLVVCLAATLYWLQTRRRGSYGLPLAIVALEVGGIALVLFRAAWIAALLVAIAAFGFRPGRFGRLFGVVAIVTVLGLAVTSGLQQNKTFTTRAQNTSTIYVRLATYKQGFEIFRSQPFFGVGVNRYVAAAALRTPETVNGAVAAPQPHNSYLGLLAEQGLVGLLPLLAASFAVWGLARGLRLASFRSKEAVLLAAMVAGAALGYLMMSVTLTMLPYEPSNTFFAALLGVASARLDALTQPSPA
jgi:O-antigen ligase